MTTNTPTKPEAYVLAIAHAATEYSTADRIRYVALTEAGEAIAYLESLKGKTLTVFVTSWSSKSVNAGIVVLNEDGSVHANAIGTIITATLRKNLTSNSNSAVAQFKSNAKSAHVMDTNEAFTSHRERFTAEIVKRLAPELKDIPTAVATLETAIEMSDSSAGTKERISVANAVQSVRKQNGTQPQRVVAKNYLRAPIDNVNTAIAALEARENLTIEQLQAFVHIVNVVLVKNQYEETEDVGVMKALATTVDTLVSKVA